MRPATRLWLTFSALSAVGLPAQALCDFRPNVREVILNTNFTQVATSCGVINVAGGVFVFRNVHIQAGTIVRGTGSNPLVFIATGTFQVDGELWVAGGSGAVVSTIRSANFPTLGGLGACGGGAGGNGSPQATGRSPAGDPGYGAGNAARIGGAGGLLSCVAGCGRGSAGGGGVFATAGDPTYPFPGARQPSGLGGNGCLNGTLPGGNAGASVFLDGVPDNDFFGLGVDLFRRRLVQGELRAPIGGQGGGGGGDLSHNSSCVLSDPTFVNDSKGGAGGGGGGVLVVLAGSDIRIGPSGRITSNGGSGGGGEQAGSNNQGGGGGGGSGGMVILLSLTGIEIQAHGETYANGDYDFALSADGGIGTQGRFGGQLIVRKYPPVPASVLNQSASGGFGGMGIVQLIAPFGANTDGTNTIFDDSVHIVQGGQRLSGAQKQRYIAWRGWFDPATQQWVDDRGNPTGIGANEGDIRPAPILLPILR